MSRWWPRLAFATAIGYVFVLGWSMQRLRYDTWGALVVAPIIAAISYPVIQRLFRGDARRLGTIVFVGLFAKMAGSLVRYWVAFDAYGGAADAGRYDAFGKELAGAIRSGEASVLRIVPSGTGTQFLERLTATIYTVFGSSRLAGFLLFGWLGFWGAMLYLRAAMIALPRLHHERYALLLMFLPSIVFWPSSIGKEAWMMLCLGLSSYGTARMLAGVRTWGGAWWTSIGLAGAAFVRPHLAGMWLAATSVALLAGLFVRRDDGRVRSRTQIVLLLGVAAVALSFVAAFAIRYLEPGNEDSATPSSAAVDIFAEVERRTEQGGSGFQTVELAGPTSWPWAIARTMTRPLLHEARSLAELLPAMEMSLLLLAAVFAWRRFASIPSTLRRSPYLLYGLCLVMMFGLAYTSIGNLGILTRQRSLAMPLMVIPWCLPRWSSTDRAGTAADGPLRSLASLATR